MSKLVPLLFAGAGVATTSVGGFYLVKGSGTSNSEENLNSMESESAERKVSNEIPAKS